MSEPRRFRPKLCPNQADIPVGQRINDLLAMANEIAAANNHTFPIRLLPADRLRAAMRLPNLDHPTQWLIWIVGELIEARHAEITYDHNDPDTQPPEVYVASAAGLARDAILADLEAGA